MNVRVCPTHPSTPSLLHMLTPSLFTPRHLTPPPTNIPVFVSLSQHPQCKWHLRPWAQLMCVPNTQLSQCTQQRHAQFVYRNPPCPVFIDKLKFGGAGKPCFHKVYIFIDSDVCFPHYISKKKIISNQPRGHKRGSGHLCACQVFGPRRSEQS